MYCMYTFVYLHTHVTVHEIMFYVSVYKCSYIIIIELIEPVIVKDDFRSTN